MSGQFSTNSDPNPGNVSANQVQTRTPKAKAEWDSLAQSWVDGEYRNDWGLAGMNAAYAYGLGYTGKGITAGVVDSGIYALHPEFKGGRIHPIEITGTYANDGYHSGGPFQAGDSFDTPGSYSGKINDPHGTHVSGSVAASREGAGMQGVAFDANLYITNTGGTDDTPDGPNNDYNYLKAAYGADAAAGARVINTSWGQDYYASDYSSLQGLISTYSLFWNSKSWLDAVADTVRQYGEIQTWAAGNDTDAVVPVLSAALPYVHPDLESHWIAVGAESPGSDPTTVGFAEYSNEAGAAKYWTIFAPGSDIDSTVPPWTQGDDWDPNEWNIDSAHQTGYTAVDGTSMSAPHATGALAVVMERYAYLGNEEARDVLLTTAEHHDAVTGSPDDTTGLAKDDAPNAIWGWGAVDLEAAMNGPGQFLGAFTVDMAADQSDTWNNTVTEDALIQRKGEDAAEQASWQQTLATKGWNKTPPTSASSVADQVAYAVGTARATAAAERAYQGSLVKKGSGTLVLDGAGSTYSGGTELDGGALEIGALGAAGTGAITFGAGPETLIIDQAAFGTDATLANTLNGLGLDDTLDFKDVAYGGGVSAHLGGDAIDLAFGSTDDRLKLQNSPQATLQLASDGSGGTLISFAAISPPSDGGGTASAPDPTPPVVVAPPVTTTPPVVVVPPVAVPPVTTAPVTAAPVTAAPDPSAPVTTLNPDGSTTTTVAAPDGTITTTVLTPDGTSTRTVLAADGSRSVQVEGGPFFDDRPYVSLTDSYAPDGTQLSETRERSDGNHAIAARAPGQSIASLANDRLSGNGQASTTFVFTPGFGQDNILGFHVFGPEHDTLSLPSSNFSSLLDVLHNTHNTAAGAVITDPTTGDTITVSGVTKAQLLHNKADVGFHA